LGFSIINEIFFIMMIVIKWKKFSDDKTNFVQVNFYNFLVVAKKYNAFISLFLSKLTAEISYLL